MVHQARWQAALNDDPLPWLLEEDDPAVRHLALRQLKDRPSGGRDVREARSRGHGQPSHQHLPRGAG